MVLRRNFLKLAPAIGALGRAWSQGQEKQEQEEDVATAGASVDTTHRVGIVLSSFTGSEDDDGSKIQGLADPAPVDAELSAGQIDAMLRKAISLGTTRRGGLTAIVASDDWVVIKPRIETCYGPGPGAYGGLSWLHSRFGDGPPRGAQPDRIPGRAQVRRAIHHRRRIG